MDFTNILNYYLNKNKLVESTCQLMRHKSVKESEKKIIPSTPGLNKTSGVNIIKFMCYFMVNI